MGDGDSHRRIGRRGQDEGRNEGQDEVGGGSRNRSRNNTGNKVGNYNNYNDDATTAAGGEQGKTASNE